MRDGLSMLEQVAAYSRGQISLEAVGAVLGTVDTDFLLTLSEALGGRQTERVMLLIRQAVEEGKDIAQLLGELIGHFRDLLLLKSGTSFEAMRLATAYEHRFEAAVAGFSVAQLLALLELLAETEKDLRWSTQHALLLEVALVRALYLLQYGGAPTLVAAPVSATAEAPRPRPQAQAAPKPSEQEESSEAATATEPLKVAKPAPEPEAEPAPEAPADIRPASNQNLIEILRARLEKEGEVSLATMVCQLWVEEDSPAKLVLATDFAFSYERLKTGDKWDVLERQAKAILGAEKQIDFVLREKKSLNPEPVTTEASTEPSAAPTVTSVVQDILARFPEAQIVDAPPEGEPDEPEQADAADGQTDAAEDDPDAGGTG
jgi:DNA polymerase III gamma/tau subunit